VRNVFFLADAGGVPGLGVGCGGIGGGLFDLTGVLSGLIDQMINHRFSIEILILLTILPYI
jgi:hypothetical protein